MGQEGHPASDATPPSVGALVVWWNSACRSIMPMLRAVSEQPGARLHVVVASPLTPARRMLGWSADASGLAPLTVLPERGWKADAARVLDVHRDALHVIGGYQRNPQLRYCATQAAKRGCRLHVMTEAPLNMEFGWRYYLKQAYLKVVVPLRTRPIVRASRGVFCLSGGRSLPLVRSGWPPSAIVPFGYFTADRGARAGRDRDGALRVLSTGLLARHKGVHVLLEALGILRGRGVPFACDIAGDGPEAPRLRQRSEHLGLEGVVRFHGVVPDARITELLAGADVLAAPGLREPWGIRVNEGIQAGLAVVVGDEVGASDLVAFSGAGAVVRSGDARGLSDALHELACHPSVLDSAQRAANAMRPWIDPRLAAEHFTRAITSGGPVPTPPWYSAQARQAVSAASRDLTT